MAATSTSPVKILLDLGIDLDNLSSEENYLSALMEGAAAIESATKGKGDGRSAILREEVIRVRKDRKAAAPSEGMKFTIKKKNISAQKLLNSSKEAKAQSEGGGDLLVIKEKVVAIEALLGEQYKLQEENAKVAREEAEKKRRSLKERLLEGSGKVSTGIKKAAEAVLKPFQSIWSKILGFLQTIFLGKVLYNILEWGGKKENQDKIKSIFRFLKDWWPALLAAYLVFGNGLTSFAIGLIGKLGWWTAQLLGPVIKGLLAAAMKMGPWGWKAAAVIGTGLAVYGVGKMMNKDKEGENLAEAQNQSTDALVDEGMDEGDASVLSQSVVSSDIGRMTQGDTNIRSDTNMLQTGMDDPLGGGRFGLNKGGTVPGTGNKDTVPAMLTPGEFVMSKGAVQKYGTSTLASMNAAGGGTNVPTVMMNGGGSVSIAPRGVNYYSQGGSVNIPSMGLPSMKFVQQFQGGGQVKQIGDNKNEVAEKTHLIQFTKIKRVKGGKQMEATITPLPGKKPKVVVVDETSSDNLQADTPQGDNQEIPNFDAKVIRNPHKIKVLGLSI